MVMNTEAATIKLSHSTSFNCPIINIPTITNAAQVTGDVNNPNTNGAKNIDKMNRIPVTTAVKPDLPPIPIPAALSTYAVTVLVIPYLTYIFASQFMNQVLCFFQRLTQDTNSVSNGIIELIGLDQKFVTRALILPAVIRLFFYPAVAYCF